MLIRKDSMDKKRLKVQGGGLSAQVEQLPCDKENLSTVIGEKEYRWFLLGLFVRESVGRWVRVGS